MSENISDKPGDAAPSEDRRNFLKTASLLGAAGAVAGAMHGKFGLAPVTQAQAQTAAAAGEMVAVEMGRHGRGRRLEPHHARQGARRRQMDPRRQDLQDRAHLRDRACRCSARAPSRCAFPGGPTGGPFGANKLVYHDDFLADRDRPGRHAVRRPRPYRHPARQGRRQERDAFLQRLHRRRDQRRLRPEEARRREAEAAVHARPPGRHPGREGPHDGRRRGDHRRRRARRAAEAEHAGKRHQARRRDLLQHRLGIALDEEQRPLQQPASPASAWRSRAG